MGSGVGDFGWRACRGPRAGVLKDLGFGGRGRGCGCHRQSVAGGGGGLPAGRGGGGGGGNKGVVVCDWGPEGGGGGQEGGRAAGCEGLDDDPPPAAARASIPVFVVATIFGVIARPARRSWVEYGEEPAGQCNVVGPVGIGEEAVVTDAMKSI